MKTYMLILLAAFTCTACAPVTRKVEFSEQAIKAEENLQRGFVLEAEISQRQRLADSAFPMTVAAKNECTKQRGLSTGIELASSGDFSKNFTVDARRLGFGDAPVVITVAAGSPAALVGLQRGDEIMAINGQKTWTDGPQAASGATKLLNLESARGNLDLRIRRAGMAPLNITLKPADACVIGVLIYRSQKSEIRVNERAALIPYQVARLASNRDELSAIAAFAIASVVKELGIPGSNSAIVASKSEASLTTVDDPRLVTQNMPLYAKDLQDADTYAVELMRRTGVSPSIAPEFWRKMIARNMLSEKDSWGTQYKEAQRMAALNSAAQMVGGRP